MPLIPPQLSSVDSNSLYPRLGGYSHVTNRGSSNIARETFTDTTHNYMNSRRVLVAPVGADLIDMVLLAPAWMFVASVEALIPNGYTLRASIEYPIGSIPTRVTWGGNPSRFIAPGFYSAPSDVYPYKILAGTPYAIKVEVEYTGSFCTIFNMASIAPNEWSNFASGTPVDHTLDLTVLTNTITGVGFSLMPMAKLSAKLVSLGIVGDSWTTGVQDIPDPLTTPSFSFMRGLRNQMLALDLGCGGANLTAVALHSAGELATFGAGISHLFISIGVNDLAQATPLATMQASYQQLIARYAGRVNKIIGATIPPRTTSTDSWVTLGNQTSFSAPGEAIRVAFNAWQLANMASLGLSSIVDMNAAIDPTGVGKWACEAGTTIFTSSNFPAAPTATLLAGVVNGILFASPANGSGYPASSSIPWTSAPYPGESGSGALGTLTTNASGVITGFTITSGGTGYTAPPMILMKTTWTLDGLHPNPRGWSEIIRVTGFAPSLFTF